MRFLVRMVLVGVFFSAEVVGARVDFSVDLPVLESFFGLRLELRDDESSWPEKIACFVGAEEGRRGALNRIFGNLRLDREDSCFNAVSNLIGRAIKNNVVLPGEVIASPSGRSIIHYLYAHKGAAEAALEEVGLRLDGMNILMKELCEWCDVLLLKELMIFQLALEEEEEEWLNKVAHFVREGKRHALLSRIFGLVQRGDEIDRWSLIIDSVIDLVLVKLDGGVRHLDMAGFAHYVYWTGGVAALIADSCQLDIGAVACFVELFINRCTAALDANVAAAEERGEVLQVGDEDEEEVAEDDVRHQEDGAAGEDDDGNGAAPWDWE